MTAPGRATRSLVAFWADAGVDALYANEAIDRMARPVTPSATEIGVAPAATIGRAPAVDVKEAVAVAAAALDLAGLEAAIAAFDGCPLKGLGARQSVFSRGAPDAPVMIVGEAPGADEDAQGAPFVGRAGRLLDKMIAAAGLEGRVFITNTVFWRPPGNRVPTFDEQAACAPFLHRAIDLVRPKFLLLAGAAAAKSVLDQKEGILSLRGRWFEWRGSQEGAAIPALPTLHPAFLLRQPAAKKKAWQDFALLSERLDRGERSA